MKKIISAAVIATATSLFADVPPCLNPIGSVDWDYFADELVYATSACMCDLNDGTGAVSNTKAGWMLTIVEPIAMLESTPGSWEFPCFNVKIDSSVSKSNGSTRRAKSHSNGFQYSHFIIYPVFSLLNFVQDMICFESASALNIMMMSEIDPSAKSDVIALFTKPQTLLTANPIAQAICAADCLSTSVARKPLNHLTWCAGCWGGLGTDSAYTRGLNPITDSALNATKRESQAHRTLQLSKTSNADFFSPTQDTGVLKDSRCKETIFMETIKSQYALQIAYPTVWDAVLTGDHPVRFDMKNKVTNKDASIFVLWRKRDFCAGAYVCKSTFSTGK